MFNAILKNIDLIENKKLYILDQWMKYDIVQKKLNDNGLQVEFFKEKFASKVFDFAISVVKSKEKIGDCPVIGVMLMLFKKKNIPLSNIFIICVHLKNTLLNFCIKEKILDEDMLNEISMLMDYNFAGVIEEYIYMYYLNNKNQTIIIKKEQGTEKSISELMSKKTTSASVYNSEVDLDQELISELNDLENDTLDTIDAQDLITQNALEESSNLFENYSKLLNTLIDFNELSCTLGILGELLHNSDFKLMDKDTQGYVQVYLKAIISDLQSWRMSIFITQEAEDIHYLDKTLLSSIAQLQITLMPQENVVVEDEIEFF